MGGGTRETCKWLGGVGEKRNGERLGKEKHKKSKQNKTNKATIKNKNDRAGEWEEAGDGGEVERAYLKCTGATGPPCESDSTWGKGRNEARNWRPKWGKSSERGMESWEVGAAEGEWVGGV